MPLFAVVGELGSGKTLALVYLVVKNYMKFKREEEYVKNRIEEVKKKIEWAEKAIKEDPAGFKEFILKQLHKEKLEMLDTPALAAEIEILEQEIEEKGPEAYLQALKNEYQYLLNWEPKHVYSNITLYDIPFYKLTTLSELNWAKNGIVLLDELWSVGLDARMSRRKKNVITANILGKSRKRSLTILFSCQTLRQLDPRIRDVLDFIAYPVISPDGKIVRLWIWRGNKPQGKPLKVVRFFAEDYYKYYNTREEVNELIDDTDDEGNGEKEPEFMYIPSSKNPAWIEFKLSKKYGVKKVI